MSKDEVRKSEPYMGVMTVSRVSGTTALFNSDVEHGHFIEVTVRDAELERHLSTNWIHPGNEIVSVWMSEIQWAQFVSSFNQGEGTPVTLHHIAGKRIPPPPSPKPEARTFQKEVTDTAKDSLASLESAIQKLSSALVPKAKLPNKTELNSILDDLSTAFLHFKNNLAFVEDQFKEHVEAKLTEAKVEFEGYVQSRFRAMGLEAAALQAATMEAPKLLAEKKD